MNLTLSRGQFERLVEGLINRTLPACEQCLKDAGISPGEIGEVILVGGMTRMPKVQEAVKKMFGRAPSKGTSRAYHCIMPMVQEGFHGVPCYQMYYIMFNATNVL